MGKKQKKITENLGKETLSVKLSITTTEGKKFIDELEKLCKKFSVNKDYFFKFQ